LQLTGGKGGVGNGHVAACIGTKLPETNKAIATTNRITLFRILPPRVSSLSSATTAIYFWARGNQRRLIRAASAPGEGIQVLREFYRQ